jgi:hypothetical protein
MCHRTTGKDSALAADTNKRALRELVSSGMVPGLIGYAGGSAVGWISLGPREDYLKLRRSPIMKSVDDTRVWSVVCTYVARPTGGWACSTGCSRRPRTSRETTVQDAGGLPR